MFKRYCSAEKKDALDTSLDQSLLHELSLQQNFLKSESKRLDKAAARNKKASKKDNQKNIEKNTMLLR